MFRVSRICGLVGHSIGFVIVLYFSPSSFFSLFYFNVEETAIGYLLMSKGTFSFFFSFPFFFFFFFFFK